MWWPSPPDDVGHPYTSVTLVTLDTVSFLASNLFDTSVTANTDIGGAFLSLTFRRCAAHFFLIVLGLVERPLLAQPAPKQ